MAEPLRLLAISLALVLTTALPWLASMLLTESLPACRCWRCLSWSLHGERISDNRKMLAVRLHRLRRGHPQRHAGGAARTVLRRAGSRAPFCAGGSPFPDLLQGSLTIVAGAAMLLSANFALSGQLAWTPGGYGVAFGRMLQDGIVAHYLRDHCPQQKLKLCPYRNELPATADQFLWGNSMFNTLGRFQGHERRDGLHRAAFARRISGCGRPRRRIVATAQQLVHVATGEGTNGWIAPHLRHHRALYPRAGQADARGAASSTGDIDFTAINRLHVPVALVSMLLVRRHVRHARSGGGGSTISRCSRRP